MAALPATSARPLGLPVRPIVPGIVGGLAAGTLLSVLFLVMGPVTGEPSDLVKLQRRSLAKVGYTARRDQARPRLSEQVSSHGGHLALSALAGGLYGAVKPDGAPPLASGAIFGVVFYGVAFGALGPTLRLTQGLSRNRVRSAAQHVFCHLLFGVVTALVADRVARRF